MKKIDVKTKLEFMTIELYNCMVKDNQTRDFYRIAYYLYFLKKANNNIFEESYVKTQTGIIWPDNEKLMLYLIYSDRDGTRELIDINYYLLLKDEMELLYQVYNTYKSYSFTKLKQLVNEDINKIKMFESLTIQEQIRIITNNLEKEYCDNPEKAYCIINEIIEQLKIKYNSQKIYKIG